MSGHLLEDLVELDIKANALLGGRRETVSARLGRRVYEKKATAREQELCKLLDIVEPDHCLKSYARSIDQPKKRHRHVSDDRSLEEDVYAVLGVR